LASQALTTAILVGIIVPIALMVSAFWTNIILERMQENEYESMKNMFVELGDKIENVATAIPGSNSELEWFDREYGRLNFLNNSINVLVSVTGANTIASLINGKTSSLEYLAGPMVGTVSNDIFGASTSTVNNLSSTLAYVYEVQENGARLELNYARIRITDVGCFWFNNEGNGKSGYLNVLRINFINITIGETTGPERIHILVKNLRTVELQTIVGSLEPITVTATMGGEMPGTYVYKGQSSVEGTTVDGTIVQVLRTDIQILSW
jgi:hypothetical protein